MRRGRPCAPRERPRQPPAQVPRPEPPPARRNLDPLDASPHSGATRPNAPLGIHGDPQSWIGDYFDQQAAEESLAVLLDSDAMLMGRNTYEYFAPAWSSPSGPYLERIHEMRKYVFSSTLTAADWNNTTNISGDPVAAVQELKKQGDRHLVIYGYGRLAQTLLEHGLVDQLNFVINPVMAGGGTTLFRPGKRTNLRLVSVAERRNGVVTLSYANA